MLGRFIINRNMSGENKQGDTVFFGPKDLTYFPFNAINELQQYRKEMNPAGIEELATSMIADPDIENHPDEVDSASFNLISPVTVAHHGLQSARKYIADHGDFYEIPTKKRISASDLVPLEDGSFIISVAGHRRKQAIRNLLGRFDIVPDNVMIAAHDHGAIPFGEALGLQLRENVHERPPAQDEARAIDQFYRELTRKNGGRAPVIATFAAQMGFSETKVRDALAFASLPERIQAFTYDGLLPYTTVRRLKTLADAYGRYYMYQPAEQAARNVEHELIVFCNQMVNMELSGNTEVRRARLIESKAKEIFNQAEYQQEGLFFLEAAAPEVRRTTSGRQLGELAVKVIIHQLTQGELSPEQREQLSLFLRSYEEEERSRVPLFERTKDIS